MHGSKTLLSCVSCSGHVCGDNGWLAAVLPILITGLAAGLACFPGDDVGGLAPVACVYAVWQRRVCVVDGRKQ